MAAQSSKILSWAKQTQSRLPHDLMENMKLKSRLYIQQMEGKIENVQENNHQNDNINVKHSTVWKSQTEEVPWQSFLSVTPTTIKILHKHTHVYTSIASFVKAGRIAKHYKAAVCISTNSFPLNFFTLQSLLLNPTPIHFQFPPPTKLQTTYQLGHVLYGAMSPL